MNGRFWCRRVPGSNSSGKFSTVTKGVFYLRSRYAYRKRNGTAPSSNVTRRAVLTMASTIVVPEGAGARAPVPSFGETDVKASSSASAGLAAAIVVHRAARAKLLDLCARTDEVAIGHEPTAHEVEAHDRAVRQEDACLLTLCRYPCRTDAARHAKASYLLGLLIHTDMSRECCLALLRSMLASASDMPADMRCGQAGGTNSAELRR